MNKLIYTLWVIGFLILAGCSVESDNPANIITFAPSEGTSYLDASREVIENNGWTLVSENGTTAGNEAEKITITGQSPEGKKVFFTAHFTAKPNKAYLDVSTEEGFPVSTERLIKLVKNEHDK